MDPCACACVSQCLYGLCACAQWFLSVCMDSCAGVSNQFSVFVWTLVPALAFLSVCMDSCVCACVAGKIQAVRMRVSMKRTSTIRVIIS